MFTEGEIFILEREKISLAVNNTDKTLKLGTTILKPQSYKILFVR